jgi:hypothetical protein
VIRKLGVLGSDELLVNEHQRVDDQTRLEILLFYLVEFFAETPSQHCPRARTLEAIVFS